MCQVPPHYSIAPEQAGSLGEEGSRIWGIRQRRKHRDHQPSPSHLKKLRPERSGSSCPTPRARASSGCGGSLCAACSPAVQQQAPPPPSPFIQSLSGAGGEKEEPPGVPRRGRERRPEPRWTHSSLGQSVGLGLLESFTAFQGSALSSCPARPQFPCL